MNKWPNKGMQLKVRYEPLLEAAPTFREYKKIEADMEKHIRAVYNLPTKC
jgi:hypothetical protein